MKKRLILGSLAFASLIASSSSYATAPSSNMQTTSNTGTNGLFITGFGGGSYLQDQNIVIYNDNSQIGTGQNTRFNLGWLAGGGIGFKQDNWEYGLESSYLSNGASKINGSSSNTSDTSSSGIVYLAKVQYDFDLGKQMIPFLNIAAGGATMNSKIDGSSKTNTGFAYQFGAGIGYQFNNHFRLSGEYDHIGTSQLNSIDSGKYYYQNNLFKAVFTWYIGKL